MNESQSHFQLGVAEFDAGRFDSAARCFEQALSLDPHRADALNNLGLCHQNQGRPAAAEACFRRALALRPHSIAALNNLGLLLRELQRFAEAAEAFQCGMQVQPDHAVLHNNLGLVLADQHRPAEAVAYFQRALQESPDYPEAHNNLGLALLNQDRFDDAEACFRRAEQLAPQFADPHLHLGVISGHRGDFPQAIVEYRAALQRNSNCTAAYYYLSLIRSADWSDGDLASAEALAGDVAGSDEDRAFANFALGNVFDYRGEYDRAFAFYRTGNGLKPSRYDPDAHEAFVSQLIDVFSAGYFESLKFAGSESQQPVFIVGMPRSGTTLVEQILAGHPDVFAAGEAAIVRGLTQRLSKLVSDSRPYPLAATGIDESAARQLASEYLEQIDPPAGRLRFTDKTPANFLHLGLIAVLFPNARIVHCRRHPLDVCLSCYCRNFQTVDYSTRWDHLGHYYRQYERIVEHWRSMLPISIHDVNYEELIDGQTRVTRTLLDACGLPWNDRCLDFHNIPRPVSTASDWQVRQPLYRASVGRWTHYERHLDELKSLLGIE